MKKMINAAKIEGTLYQHSLELRVSGQQSKKPNVEYIRGSIDIATNNAMTNIVSVYFGYTSANYGSGKPNTNYPVLKGIIDGLYGCYTDPNVKDNAAKVRIDTSIALNDFYSNRSGTEELISAKRLEGGFIHITPSINENENMRNRFETDIVICGVKVIDAVLNETTGEIMYPEKADIDGRIFGGYKDNFTILPVHFSAINPAAINYFLGLNASKSDPVFTKVKGSIVSEQGVRYITEESAFGDASVREVRTSHKDYVIDWAATTPYDIGPESGLLTMEDLKTLAQERETYLATIKSRAQQTMANNAISSSAEPAKKEFNF